MKYELPPVPCLQCLTLGCACLLLLLRKKRNRSQKARPGERMVQAGREPRLSLRPNRHKFQWEFSSCQHKAYNEVAI